MPERTALTFNAWLRYDVIRRILERRFREARTFLEIGCGQGAFAVRLAQLFTYVGVEPDPTSSLTAMRRTSRIESARVVRGDLPFEPSAYFDLAGAFEVLEHLADDVGALRAWRRWLRPGGGLLLSVPAHQHRYSRADEAVGHYRRYGREQLASLLTHAGYEAVEIVSYGFPLGHGLEWARNRLAKPSTLVPLEERSAASGRFHQPRESLWWLTQATTAPFRLLQRPFEASDLGTGFVVSAKAPVSD